MTWTYENKEVTDLSNIVNENDTVEGFVYCIEFSNGKKYIGKKNFFHTVKKKLGKKELSKITDKRLKDYKIVKRESDWLKYNGSSRKIKEDLQKGVEPVKKEILLLASSKKELTYLETQCLFCNKVLEKGDEYYNDNILGKFYRNK